MSVHVVYETTARATGGRDGTAETLDGRFKVQLGTPKALGGNDSGNNPEQLFAAGYAACFLGALRFVAQHEGHSLPSTTTVDATVGLGPRREGGFGLKVALAVYLPGMKETLARELLKKTETVCPYAHATKGNISTTLTLHDQPPPSATQTEKPRQNAHQDAQATGTSETSEEPPQEVS